VTDKVTWAARGESGDVNAIVRFLVQVHPHASCHLSARVRGRECVRVQTAGFQQDNRSGPRFRQGKVYGFIAQQIKEHIPEAVKFERGTLYDIHKVLSCNENIINIIISEYVGSYNTDLPGATFFGQNLGTCLRQCAAWPACQSASWSA
jgi:hypothetical protein